MKNIFTLRTLKLLATVLLFFAATKTSNAQTVTFELLQQPCNNDGVLVMHFPGITLPATLTLYIGNWSTQTEYVINAETDTLFNYSGAMVYVYTNGFQGYYNGAPPFTYTVTTTPAVCPDLGTGEVTMTGGQAPYIVEWYDEAGVDVIATGNPADLPGGAFMVQITDANGCVSGSMNGGDSIWVYNDSPIVFNISSTLASCTNGTASVTNPAGGIAPYTYQWSNGAISSTITGLVMGAYTVRVTDAQGCFNDGYTYVEQTPYINVNPSVTPATCLQNDGEIWAFGSGGQTPYTYLWSDGQTVQHATGLAAGYYQVTATDANGCISYTQVVEVNASTPITVTYSSTSSLCTAPTGTATITPTGGTLPYTIVWNTFPGQTGTTATGLQSGTYSFNVTDAVGCVRSGSVYVPPVSVIYAAAYGSSTDCNTANGSASVSVFSGSAPYTYLWSTGATTTSISNLPAGGYSCTITDNEGCTVVKGAGVQSISPVHLSRSSTPQSCIFVYDGTATVNAWGGTPPYTYYWSNGATTSTITGLNHGDYYVSATDAAGCSQSTYVYVGYNPGNTSCYCTIIGTVYHDVNENCVQDNGEPGIHNIMVRTSSYGGDFTDANGNYSLIVPTGSYTVSENIEAFYPLSACQNNAIPVNVTAAPGCSTVVNFGNVINPIHSIGVYGINYSGPPVVGNTYYHNFIVKNEGTVDEYNVITGYQHDGQLNYQNENPALFTQLDPASEPDWYSITTGDFPGITPGTGQSFSVQYAVPTNIPLGTSILINDSAVYQSPMSDWINDYTPWNNVNSLYTNVVASYDPNNKEVNPKGYGEEGQITHNDSILTYTIHFQNTGTWPAQNIYLLDTLPATLNLSTLRPVYSNHDFTTSFTEDGVVKFQFDNINLPDSASQPLASIGYVIYTIHLQPGLPFGTQIQNSADIYFDYNAPVKTNTTLNTIVRNVGISEQEQPTALSLYPNPSNNAVTVVTELTKSNYQLLDITGKTLLQGSAASTKFTLDISSLSSGVYFISVSDGERQVNGKIVKE